jgi:hypothetical protein
MRAPLVLSLQLLARAPIHKNAAGVESVPGQRLR